MRNIAPCCLRAASLAVLCSVTFCLATVRAADELTATPTATPAVTGDSAASIAMPAGLSPEEVKDSILQALLFRKYTVQDQSEDSITASIASGNIVLLLKIRYSASEVTLSVNQWDSRPKAQKRQERWVANIRKDIADNVTKPTLIKHL
jgi:hypothetical protein